ncbi:MULTISPECIES: DUF1672 family protein [Cytobacillus]|uniref:DUF1672 family protein n=2 Tax=Cytobacillus TaxID=2675230 RepID=A0ABX3CP71_9BACI|nr:DUF1672 family protein [Cytobacillus oceanisediminis]EFV78261.1 hypothetical protein HMPREF1013_01449 [Bacillus sp. 2_A_57_CT2]MCM3403632.1 DUF1672 domain-containing protein [Cytobacillus oceanisediminis]MDK7666863.1 DUF1672 family protein [Cytobacillus oceanisediminis]OHX45313.1 hypothetical protein BBV17_23730 [Cytobacillus oceanisediminis]QOK25847.1 DUF1672 family protein [Cytobacillus oceanisediminis]
MHKKTKILLCSVGISLMLGGCSGMNSANNNQESEKSKETQAAPSEESQISVQDYTGEGYALPYGKETDKIADESLDQIEEATIKFFKEKYKTDVTVHNVVGAKDGATVFVESKGEPHFYTYAVVPIDELEKKVMTEKIWADEFQVENAIKGGLYHMIFKEEFKQLDKYLETLAAEGQVTGKTKEALQNVGGQGFSTPYYFISMRSKEAAIKPVYDLYMKNPDESEENLRNAFEDSSFAADNLFINIQLFMADKNAKPNKELFDQITKDLEEMTSIPRGSYSFVLNDNFIDKQSSSGMGDNSLDLLKDITKE